MIKCLTCQKRVRNTEMNKGFTCNNCTEFLSRFGYQYQDGEKINTYILRIKETLGVK
jgi:hypothetical protein